MHNAFPAAAVILMAATAVSAEFDGIYRQAADSDCSLVGVDGGALKIEEDVFYGVESTCNMTDPVPVNDMDAVLYRMRCSSEDGAWTARAMMVHGADGGLIMVWDGYAFKYDSCPDPDASNPVTDSIPVEAQAAPEAESDIVEPAKAVVPDEESVPPESETPDVLTEEPEKTESDAG
ncbi:MAG: hypothetical protein MRY81_14070 [Donghicola eburneus]|nr:hypothetical protein [Donghicola eburneus]MCI5040798.1 hypothetical protein [Donghicola eburneus]